MNTINIPSDVKVLRDRQTAAQRLADKLASFKSGNAIVIATSLGGAPIGFHLAHLLHLPFELRPCRKIRHPADKSSSIGSVSAHEAVVQQDIHDTPNEYVTQRISMLQHSIRLEQETYAKNKKAMSLRDKQVILVDDVLRNSDNVEALIRSVRKEMPFQVIVAAAVVSPEASGTVGRLCDALVFLGIDSAGGYGLSFSDFQPVTHKDLRSLLQIESPNEQQVENKTDDPANTVELFKNMMTRKKEGTEA